MIRKNKDTSVAVCYHENKLYISSNRKNPKYALEYMEKLQEFVKNPYERNNYEELLKEAVNQICQINPEGSARNSKANTPSTSATDLSAISEELTAKSVLESFREKARECKVDYENNQQPKWDELQETAEKLFQEVKTEGNSQKWKFLTPWQDTFIIVEAIIKNELDKNILEAIQQKKISPVNSEDEGDNSENKKTHAEMKIISRLYKKQIKRETQEIKEKDLKPLLYIGSAKKTCAKCQAVIDRLDNDKYRWDVHGTHGSNKHRDGSNNKWKKPGIINEYKKEVEVEEITTNMIEKLFKKDSPINHTTSEIPESSLSNPVELLKKLQTQELKAQTEQSK